VAAAVVGFVVSLALALLRVRAFERRQFRAGPRKAPFDGPQIVGRECAQCRVKVALFFDATWCKHCGDAVHHDCLAAHLAPSDGPYR